MSVQHYKTWPYFRLCNIDEPVSPTSSVSPDRKSRKERNSPLGKLPHYNNQTKHKWGIGSLRTYNTSSTKTLNRFSNSNQSKWGNTSRTTKWSETPAEPLLQRSRHTRRSKRGSVLMHPDKLCLLPSKSLHDRSADMTLSKFCIWYKYVKHSVNDHT
jgi:hypothetical protein